MKVSARNVFEGTITLLTPGAVNAEVELTTAGGLKIVAIVTIDSIRTLGLAVGKTALAFVKAPWVMVLADDVKIKFSARNRLSGTVSAITKGAINGEVSITLADGNAVHAVVTNDAIAEMGLSIGSPASALIKACHVILGVPA